MQLSNSQRFDPVLTLGLNSGSSCGGVQAALLRTDGEASTEFLFGKTYPYEESVAVRLAAAMTDDVSLHELMALEQESTDGHAAAVRELLAEHSITEEVAIVGMGGHLLRQESRDGLTFRIGDASRLAEALDTPVVHRFCKRDLAAGGEGGPLTTLYLQTRFESRQDEWPCAVLDLGSVAHLGVFSADGVVAAGDTGPGCLLLDAWTEEHAGTAYDAEGGLALRGRVSEGPIAAALKTPFFEKLLPKSAGRDDFMDVIDVADLPAADGAATLAAFSADAVWKTVTEHDLELKNLWVAGGGSRHPRIVQRLIERFAPLGTHVGNIAEVGLRADTLEAEALAWLAVRRLRGLPTHLPQVTGARHAVVGGELPF